MQLAELRPGQKFRVKNVTVGGEIGKRLADLGIVEGAEGEVVRAAFFRGPMQIRLGDYDLIMRRFEARLVMVEPLNEPAAQSARPQEACKQSQTPYSTLHPRVRPHGWRRSLQRNATYVAALDQDQKEISPANAARAGASQAHEES